MRDATHLQRRSSNQFMVKYTRVERMIKRLYAPRFEFNACYPKAGGRRTEDRRCLLYTSPSPRD
eukprot:8942018-Alexandrium_andersonii.AAC.1